MDATSITMTTMIHSDDVMDEEKMCETLLIARHCSSLNKDAEHIRDLYPPLKYVKPPSFILFNKLPYIKINRLRTNVRRWPPNPPKKCSPNRYSSSPRNTPPFWSYASPLSSPPQIYTSHDGLSLSLWSCSYGWRITLGFLNKGR